MRTKKTILKEHDKIIDEIDFIKDWSVEKRDKMGDSFATYEESLYERLLTLRWVLGIIDSRTDHYYFEDKS